MRKNVWRLALLAAGLACLGLQPGEGLIPNAAAQSPGASSWPSRTVKFVVPVAGGTATDLTARIFADKLTAKWGQ